MKLDDLIEFWRLLSENSEGNVSVSPAIMKATLEHLEQLEGVAEGIDGLLGLIKKQVVG